MPQFRKKPALVEATQWFRNGDHPYDGSTNVDTTGPGTTLTEGKVVRFFRLLHIPGDRVCQECGNVMHKHGLIYGLNSEEETVHPGDYIVTDTKGRFYRRSGKDFEAMFEPYDPDKTVLLEATVESIDMNELFERVSTLWSHFTSPRDLNPPTPITPDPGKVQ